MPLPASSNVYNELKTDRALESNSFFPACIEAFDMKYDGQILSQLQLNVQVL